MECDVEVSLVATNLTLGRMSNFINDHTNCCPDRLSPQSSAVLRIKLMPGNLSARTSLSFYHIRYKSTPIWPPLHPRTIITTAQSTLVISVCGGQGWLPFLTLLSIVCSISQDVTPYARWSFETGWSTCWPRTCQNLPFPPISFCTGREHSSCLQR